MIKRTDLAVEAKETIKESIKGIDYSEEKKNNLKITKMKVKEEQAATKLNKPIGNYITIDIPNLKSSEDDLEENAKIISKLIRDMLPSKGNIFVAGLGNKDITPDNLGPKTLSHILATRHITGEIAKESELLSSLRSVAALSPGVLGQTGIETGEILFSISRRLKPAALIVIDALASIRLERLGTTIQISDTGISPGAGVGNSRPKINKETMGIPVISIGVPTVVDAITLASDLLNDESKIDSTNISSQTKYMMVTPREIDLLITRASKLLGLSINMALQEKLSSSDILALVS